MNRLAAVLIRTRANKLNKREQFAEANILKENNASKIAWLNHLP